MVDLDELASALMDHPTKFVGVIEAAGSIEDILEELKLCHAQYLRARAVEARENGNPFRNNLCV